MVKPDPTRNYYADLGISPNADNDEIRKAFRKLALTYHPDRNPGKEAEFVAQFQAIQAAQEVLIDPVARAKYDAERRKYRTLNIPAYNSPRAARPPPPPRNTYTTTAAGGYSYRPPPPRPPPPQSRPTRPEAQTRPTNSVPNGAERFKNFPKPPPTSRRADTRAKDAQDRANVFTAWQNMKQRQKEAEEGFAHARRPSDNPPSSGSEKPFGRSQSTRVPKGRGFDPTMPGADEPQAPGSAYRSGYQRPGPSPTLSEEHPDPLRHFKDQMKGEGDVPFSEGQDRVRTPYYSTKGERTSMFSDEDLRRSASQRNSPINRPGSSEHGGFWSDSGTPGTSRPRKPFGGNATRPFAMYSSSSDSDSDTEEIPPPRKPKVPPRKSADRQPQWTQPGVHASQANGTADRATSANEASAEEDPRANMGGFKSRSAESINMKFSPNDWHGKFEGKPDYFAPNPFATPSGKGRQSPTRGRSASNRPKPTNTASPFAFPPPPAGPPPAQSSQMPPPPRPAPPPLNTQAGPASAPPHTAKFTPEEWQETFKEPNWAYPVPNKDASPVRPTSNAAKRGGRSGAQRRPSVVPQGVPVVDLTGESPKKPAGKKTKAGTAGPQAVAEEISSDDDDAMDIDPHSPPVDGHSKEAMPSTRSVPSSPQDTRNGTMPKQAATAPTSATEPLGPGLDGLGSLKNVAPFAPTSNGGLGELNDIKSSLPFDSQASTAHPKKRAVPRKLNLPLMPTPPQVEYPLEPRSFNKYAVLMHVYVTAFRKFNGEMLNHFAAREAEMDNLDAGWLKNVGETTNGMGFDSYMRTLEEDNRAREHWTVGCEKHQATMKHCEEVRKKFFKVL